MVAQRHDGPPRHRHLELGRPRLLPGPRAQLEGYLRGRSAAERFGWHYSDEELEEIRGRLEGLAREVPTVRMMLNNTTVVPTRPWRLSACAS
ncbi:MAG: hypothetical protein M3459_10125 [Actinomycetota bacterium]|nr:hypothetical protein [Actinomycetota bacterium]